MRKFTLCVFILDCKYNVFILKMQEKVTFFYKKRHFFNIE